VFNVFRNDKRHAWELFRALFFYQKRVWAPCFERCLKEKAREDVLMQVFAKATYPSRAVVRACCFVKNNAGTP